jgi:hypothetical protein
MNDMVSMRKTRPLGLAGMFTGVEAVVAGTLGIAEGSTAGFDGDVLRGGKLLV